MFLVVVFNAPELDNVPGLPQQHNYLIMCRCALKNEAYNNTELLFLFNEMQISGGVYCNLAI